MSTDDLSRDQIRLDASYQKALAALKQSKTPVFTPRLEDIDLSDYGQPGYKVRIKKGSSPVAGGTLNPHHFYATLYAPHGAVQVDDDDTVIGALSRLIKSIRNAGDTALAKALDKAYTIELEAWDAYRNQPRKQARVKKLKGDLPRWLIMPTDIETAYRKFAKAGSKDLATHVLGDPVYDRRVKMPKWNREVTLLDEPQVAIRYNTSWGIPTSKDAHRQRAEHFAKQKIAYNRAWNEIVHYAEKEFGDGNGHLISGVNREHYPTEVKDRLRFLAQGQTELGDAVKLHQFLSKTRSPIFK